MVKYFRTSYKFGSLGGGLSVIAFFLLSYSVPDPSTFNMIFGYILTPVAVFLSIKFFKEYTGNGYLSFAEGMSVGFVTYMLIAIISCLGIWTLLLISPDLFEQINLAKLEILHSGKESIISQVGEESYRLTLKSIEGMTPSDIALNDGIWKLITGLFFTIIISIILRKNPN